MPTLKDIFDKEILVEGKNHLKGLKIFYEIDFNIIKNSEDNEQKQVPVQSPQPEQNQMPAPEPVQQPAPESQPQAEPPVQQPEPTPEPEQNQGVDTNSMLSSVVTEDEKDTLVSSDNKIIRKMEGIVELSNSQKDNTQNFDDLISILSETKKDGVEILDEFTAELLTLCSSKNFEEIKKKIDKKSKIFFELYYGYSKEDSVGLRFVTRPNSDTMTYTMIIDNEVLSATFSIDRINQKIAEYRNYEMNKTK